MFLNKTPVSARVGMGREFVNRLIKGENLEVLKSLEEELSEKVKCIYIDPPYNTKQNFSHYKDNLRSTEWLNMMKERLVILRRLLREDGSIWISIDDDECHYLKVLCDEIFGRKNFVANIVWQHSIQSKSDPKGFSGHHNFILVYQKSSKFELNRLLRECHHNKAYSNPDNDPNGPWRSGDVRSPSLSPSLVYALITPCGKKFNAPPNGWRWCKETILKKIQSKEIVVLKNKILRKIYLKNQKGRTAESIWFGGEVGTTREANKEIRELFPIDVFSTPKPERLIHRILHLATNPGDLVLDCFAGSGTTGAVAHKMKRRWIMVEKGDHCETHIVPRIQKVIEGVDLGGITNQVDWHGGGHFQYINY